MIKVTGNTYPAKELLERYGFVWDKEQRAFFGNENAKKELDKHSTASAGRRNQNLVAALKFQEIDNERPIIKFTIEIYADQIEWLKNIAINQNTSSDKLLRRWIDEKMG